MKYAKQSCFFIQNFNYSRVFYTPNKNIGKKSVEIIKISLNEYTTYNNSITQVITFVSIINNLNKKVDKITQKYLLQNCDNKKILAKWKNRNINIHDYILNTWNIVDNIDVKAYDPHYLKILYETKYFNQLWIRLGFIKITYGRKIIFNLNNYIAPSLHQLLFLCKEILFSYTL